VKLHEALSREAFLERLALIGMTEDQYWADLRATEAPPSKRPRERPKGGLGDNDSFGGGLPADD